MQGKNLLVRSLLGLIGVAAFYLMTAGVVSAEVQVYGLLGTGKVDTDLEPANLLDFGNDFQVGGGFNVLGGEGVKVGLGVELNYFTASDSFEDVEFDVDSTITTLNLAVEGAGPVRPFVSAGIGFANSHLTGSAPSLGISVDGQDYGLAYGAGGGLKLVLGEVFFVGGDFHYFWIQTDPESVRAYRFAGLVGAKF